MEFSAHVAEQLQLPPEKMSKNLKNTLNRYGFNDADLADLSKVKPYDNKGVGFLTSESILNSGLENAEALQRKYMGMILQEAEYAALTPDAAVRATFGADQRGTWKGEFLLSTAMFKSFPLTIINTHIMRGLNQSTTQGKAAYLTALVLGTGAVASLGLQAKELAAGREPRPMNDWRFFAQSIMLGGGMGIFGDILFADHNRFGQSNTVTAGGVLLSTAEDFIGTAQTGVQMMYKDDVTFGDFASQFLSSAQRLNFLDTWQTRLVMERLLFNQLQVLADPKAKAKFARQAASQKRDYGNSYFWPKGEALPEGLR